MQPHETTKRPEGRFVRPADSFDRSESKVREGALKESRPDRGKSPAGTLLQPEQ